jgi:arylsulfatase A-like enzyme
LDVRGLSGNTLVVFTADHGQSLFEHGYVGHSGALYAQTVNVPLIMRHPVLLPAGLRVGGLVQGVDVVPTILDLLGMEPVEVSQGRSLLSRIGTGDRGDSSEITYFETLHSTNAGERFRGVIAGEWKLIRSEDGSTVKLYHLPTDPEERVDLSGKETDRVVALEDLLVELVGESGMTKEGERIEVDSRTRDMLRSLGYVW